jgi:hypothetical protein
MRSRMTASVLSALCAWVLWEKWIVHNPGQATQRIIEAVSESKTLAECRADAPSFAKQRADRLRNSYKEADYAVTEGNFGAILFDKHRKSTSMEYVFYCLPPTVDPYRDPQ